MGLFRSKEDLEEISYKATQKALSGILLKIGSFFIFAILAAILWFQSYAQVFSNSAELTRKENSAIIEELREIKEILIMERK